MFLSCIGIPKMDYSLVYAFVFIFQILGPVTCEICMYPLMDVIPDRALTASSEAEVTNPFFDRGPERARFNTSYEIDPSSRLERSGGWTAGVSDRSQWIQVSFHKAALVRAIVTQGRGLQPDLCCPEWVTRYRLEHSLDGQTWETYKEPPAGIKVFSGNTDNDTPVLHRLSVPIIARFVRIIPITWRQEISMRLDLFGCGMTTPTLGEVGGPLPMNTIGFNQHLSNIAEAALPMVHPPMEPWTDTQVGVDSSPFGPTERAFQNMHTGNEPWNRPAGSMEPWDTVSSPLGTQWPDRYLPHSSPLARRFLSLIRQPISLLSAGNQAGPAYSSTTSPWLPPHHPPIGGTSTLRKLAKIMRLQRALNAQNVHVSSPPDPWMPVVPDIPSMFSSAFRNRLQSQILRDFVNRQSPRIVI